MSDSTPLVDTTEMLRLLRPISHRAYREKVRPDPRWPGPVHGGPRTKALYSRQAILAYVEEVARDGWPHIERGRHG